MFTVFVEDLMFGERDILGEYSTYEEALAKSKSFIDENVRNQYEPDMSSETLYWWLSAMDLPFIVPDREDEPFSAKDYTKSRCLELANREDTGVSIKLRLKFKD